MDYSSVLIFLSLSATLLIPIQAVPARNGLVPKSTPGPTCGGNLTPIPSDCCTSKPPPPYPWSTNVETCPSNQHQCCTETKEVVTAAASNTDLKCGKDAVRTSTITVTFETCKNNQAEQCLHIVYNNVQGTTYNEFHLQIDDVPITSSIPGQMTFSTYCSLTTGNTAIDCWVPQPAILATFSPPVSSLCGKTIYVAAHSTISDGNTCWVGVTPIEQKSNNWAKYFSINFSCITECTHACCCPPPPPPPPPPTDYVCDVGTAFAKSNYNLNPDLGCKRWGWYFPEFTSSFTADLVLGQTTTVGTISVTVTSAGVTWSFNPTSPYGLIEAHVDLLCGPIPPKNPPKDNPCAPGQYTYNSGCLNYQAGKPWLGTAPACADGKYWAIFHAKISKTGSTSCSAPVCPDPDPDA